VPLFRDERSALARVSPVRDEDRPDPRRCRPQGSCPSRRFWLPDASRPCFMPLASRSCPSRAFPPRGAVLALASLCFLAGSKFRPHPARCPQDLHVRFPLSRQLESRDDGSSRPLVQSPRRTRRHAARSVHSPRTPGSPCTTGTPASKLCSPRGSVPHAPRLGQTRNWRPVLSWGCRPPELSPPRSGFGHSRRRTRGARCPCRIRRQESSRRGCRPRSGLRPRAHEPGIRRCATS